MISKEGPINRREIEAKLASVGDYVKMDYLKAMDLFIKGGGFDDADISFTKALGCAEGMQKERIKRTRKEAYLKQADGYLAGDKRKHAMEAYQRYLTFPEVTGDERKSAQQALLGIYEKLGKITEYGNLKRSMTQPAQPNKEAREQSRTSSFSWRDIGL